MSSASACGPSAKLPSRWNGSSAKAGTRLSGRSRSCPRAGIWTRSAANIRFTSNASTDTLAWPTRAPCSSPASPSPAAIPRAERSIAMKRARPTAFCARRRRRWCSRRFPNRHAREAAASHRTGARRSGKSRHHFRAGLLLPVGILSDLLEELEREGKLTARISEWLPFDDSIESLNHKRDSHPASDNMLHTGTVERLHGWFAGLEDGRVA